MKIDACPDQLTLEKLLLGKLSGTEQESLSLHLQNCQTCASVADTLMPRDEVTDALRSHKVLKGDEEILAAAIERGKKLSSRLQTVQPAETVIRAGASSQPKPADDADTGRDFSFLALAQQPDELGRLGDYRILQVLGMGGMGVVFRAEDTKLKRLVALKVMKPSVAATRSAKDRFLREAQFTAAIEHDNIVQIYQVGEDRGVPFIAMQFLKGESLKSRLERDGILSQTDVVKIGVQVAAGMAAAHERNLIHRDIKPDNIWLEQKTGRAKILDFGLVRASSDDAGLTQSGMVMGTPRYMAPEQALGQDVDYRCDLFSLGSMLYHMATGKLPFEGSNVTATLMAVVQQEAKPIDKIVPGLHPSLGQLIQKLMAKDRDKRPKSASEVAKSLIAIHQKLKQAANTSVTGSHPGPARPEDAPKPVASAPSPVLSETPAVPQQTSFPAAPADAPLEFLPVIKTEPTSALARHKPAPTKTSPQPLPSQKPPAKPPLKKIMAACGAGGILLVLLGIIVIKIRDKDGKESTIRVSSGTEIDVDAAPGSKVTIREEETSGQASSQASSRTRESSDSQAST